MILEEGITEAGSMASFIAAGTSHYSVGFHSIPFFIFYSMFSFQRIGDLIWAAADSGARGFMIGGISGRTSLSGEGLQHADGQSHLYAMAFPSVQAYDPAFAYEVALIIQDGLKRMYANDEDIFYYLTVTNQAYEMPPMPEDVDQGILKGLYLFKKTKKQKNKERTVNLLGSGAIMQEVLQAARMLEKDHDIPVNIWSATSYKTLYDDALEVEKNNLADQQQDENHIQQQLDGQGGLFIAATDFVKAVPLSIAKWIPGNYRVLGTDGFGRSDTVQALRSFFQVDAAHIVYATLYELAAMNKLDKDKVSDFQQSNENLLTKSSKD